MAKPPEKEQAHIVRIMGTGINGSLSSLYGLAKIKGVGVQFSNAVCVVLGLDKAKKISDLSEKEIEKIETYLSGENKKGIPTWMLNTQRDPRTGEDLHFAAKDLDFHALQVKRDTIKLKTYRGQRIKAGLPVRGQRTKANFRKQKMFAAMKSKSVGGKK